MKNVITSILYIIAVTLSSSLLTGCQAIGDIFSAGVYVGIFLVVAVVIVIVVIVGRLGKK
jgi:hypothetical protein